MLRYLGLSPPKLKGQFKFLLSWPTYHLYTIKLPQFIRKILEFITLNEFLSWRHPSLVPPRPVASISHFIAVHKGIIMPTCPWASMERREVVWEKLFPTGGPQNKNMEMCIFLDSTAPPAETVFLPWSCIKHVYSLRQLCIQITCTNISNVYISKENISKPAP